VLWEADEPDHVEDVGGQDGRFVDRKLDALEAHASQFESTMKATDDDQLTEFRSRIRVRLAGLGEPFGYAAAEIFKLITDL
jgi:LmbE family N-acetylglucosaminyl deacetylase